MRERGRRARDGGRCLWMTRLDGRGAQRSGAGSGLAGDGAEDAVRGCSAAGDGEGSTPSVATIACGAPVADANSAVHQLTTALKMFRMAAL
ncbi:hypothetical protein SAMN04489719_0959 [Agrococcus carbonis]|uniref:Uncharacterized protein n=1 Tax=Agrococcus carbonis TaxID=684552 RepID=A0A1H1MEU3_9MICO|nr:hypothetical protein SAMN04489719_0959 [Agrococcus carbonis]